MSRAPLSPSRGDLCFKPAVIFTLIAFAGSVWAGFYSPADDLLELIKQGEVVKIEEEEPEPEIPDLVMVEFSPPPPAEANPEFVKPVEAPAPTPEAIPPEPTPTPPPEPTPPPPPAPEPTPTPEPTPAATPKSKPKAAPQSPKQTKPKPVAKPQPAVKKPAAQPSYASSTPVLGNRNFPRPPYPLDAKRRRAQGTVDLSITVANGRIVSVEVVGSSGHASLDSGTRSWIKSRWRFPAGVTRTLQQSITFDLRQ